MRVLATMRADEFPPAPVDPYGFDQAWGRGLVYRFDHDSSSRTRESDHGWIGEDDRGVWIAEPPIEALAVRCPDLGDVVLEHWRGLRKPRPSDLARFTERQSQAKIAMYGAHCRERERAMKRQGDIDG